MHQLRWRINLMLRLSLEMTWWLDSLDIGFAAMGILGVGFLQLRWRRKLLLLSIVQLLRFYLQVTHLKLN